MVTEPYVPLLVDPRRLLLDMAREHGLSELLRLVVGRLAESPRVALARIWLVEKSEDCAGCRMAPECPDRSACLHLAASAGRSVIDARVEWTRLDGAFRRLPLGVREVGRIAATGEPTEALGLLPDPPAWVADPRWIRDEGVTGFGGQPLIHRGEVLGVLGVFARGPVGRDCMDWLRAIADGAAERSRVRRGYRLRFRLNDGAMHPAPDAIVTRDHSASVNARKIGFRAAAFRQVGQESASGSFARSGGYDSIIDKEGSTRRSCNKDLINCYVKT